MIKSQLSPSRGFIDVSYLCVVLFESKAPDIVWKEMILGSHNYTFSQDRLPSKYYNGRFIKCSCRQVNQKDNFNALEKFAWGVSVPIGRRSSGRLATMLMVTINDIIGTSGRCSCWSAFGQSTGNDVSFHDKQHCFLFPFLRPLLFS